jgi:hypothetical protein
MKITTEKELWVVAENWYQRTHKLREVWQDYDASDKRKVKAFYLWNIMAKRMLNISHKAFEISQPKPPKYFPKGGISFERRPVQ